MCRLALPLQVIVVKDSLDAQQVTNQCSRCGVPVVAYTRIKSTGAMKDRYIHPAFPAAIKEHREEVQEYLKLHPGKAKILVPGDDSDLISSDDLVD